MFELNQRQLEAFKKYIQEYSVWKKTKEGQENLIEHLEHNKYLSNELAKNKLNNLSEDVFRKIYKFLWASNNWTNKEWCIETYFLKPYGIKIIRENLFKLLYGENDISERIDEFRKKIKGFGFSHITEIIHFVFPDKYCLWNTKPKTVLPFIGLNILPERFFNYSLHDGKDYTQCLEFMTVLKQELVNKENDNPNFLDLDCVLYYIFTQIDKKSENKEKENKKIIEIVKKGENSNFKSITSHEQAEYYLLKLGNILGYLTYTVDKTKKFENEKIGNTAILKDIPDFAGQRDINSAREIDVIWFNEDENPEYCIEVEHTTDITKGLNRLIQLKQFNVKFIIVAPDDRKQKFETELSKYPNRILKDRCNFISYSDLIKLCKISDEFKNIKDKLL